MIGLTTFLWVVIMLCTVATLVISDLWLILGKVGIVVVRAEDFLTGYYIASVSLLILGLNSWFIKYFDWGKSNQKLIVLNQVTLSLYVAGGGIFFLLYRLPAVFG